MTGCALQDHTPVRLLTSSPTVSYPQQMLWPLWPAGHSWGELYLVTPHTCIHTGPSVGNALLLHLYGWKFYPPEPAQGFRTEVSRASPKCLTWAAFGGKLSQG